MSKVAEVVGTNLRNLRVAAGITQEEIAEAMRSVGFSWHRPTVAEVEAGRRPLTIEELPVVAAYFEMPITALLVAPGGLLELDEVEIGGRHLDQQEWVSLVDRWGHDEPAPKLAQRAIDTIWGAVDRPWASRWRRRKGPAVDAYRGSREQALAKRTKLPGPAYLAEQKVTVTTHIPPWSDEIKIKLEPGQVYVARDEYERMELDEIAATRNPSVRRITPQEAYRRRKQR